MDNMDIIKQYLSNVLDQYKEYIGWGFFTRQSRIQVMNTLRSALASHDNTTIIYTLLNFANSMQGKADVGKMGHSHLHDLLWGNTLNAPRTGGLYQMLYDFLLTQPGIELSKGLSFTNYRNRQLTLGSDVEQNRVILESLIGYNWGRNHSLSRIANPELYSPCLIRGCVFS